MTGTPRKIAVYAYMTYDDAGGGMVPATYMATSDFIRQDRGQQLKGPGYEVNASQVMANGDTRKRLGCDPDLKALDAKLKKIAKAKLVGKK